MSASLLFRIWSGLLVLFAAGHTLGFRKVHGEWGVDPVVAAMRTTQLTVQGFSRTYWDFYLGFGFFVTAILLFSAVLTWQLGGMAKETLRLIPAITWRLAICFVSVTFLSWKYFFAAPVVFSRSDYGVLAVHCLASRKGGLVSQISSGF